MNKKTHKEVIKMIMEKLKEMFTNMQLRKRILTLREKINEDMVKELMGKLFFLKLKALKCVGIKYKLKKF